MRVLTLVRGKGGLRQPDRLGPFVNSVCNHVLFEHYRSQKRTEATIDDEVETTIACLEPSALSLLEAKDTERVVLHTHRCSMCTPCFERIPTSQGQIWQYRLDRF